MSFSRVNSGAIVSLTVATLVLYGLACHELSPTTSATPSPSTSTQPALPNFIGLAKYRVTPSFESAVKKFESSAATQPVRIGGTVFLGSSSFTRWKTMEKDMAQFDAVNRGFGGSRTDDILYYAHRILSPLAPKRIVYYCGGNDIDRKRSPDIAVGNVKVFAAQVRSEFPGVKIYFVSTNYTPKRAPITNNIRLMNEAIEAWAKTQSDIFYIYAMDGLIDGNNKANPKLFMPDGVHLNPDGNKIWMVNISRELESRY